MEETLPELRGNGEGMRHKEVEVQRVRNKDRLKNLKREKMTNEEIIK